MSYFFDESEDLLQSKLSKNFADLFKNTDELVEYGPNTLFLVLVHGKQYFSLNKGACFVTDNDRMQWKLFVSNKMTHREICCRPI